MGKNQFKETEMSEVKRRGKYTLEFKMEAVRLVKGGQGWSGSVGDCEDTGPTQGKSG